MERRFYRYKKPVTEFFCPLCRTPRAFTSRPRLGLFHFVQIAIVSAVCILLLFDAMKERVFFLPLVIWGAFEFGVRLRFKQQIPCPHCGFDASWYKRNIRVAQEKVRQFWQRN